MKRDHQQPWDAAMSNGSNTGGGGSKNIWPEEEEDDDNDNMDELLAVLGYKVRSSDMADVAERIEQLETVLSQDDVSGSDLLNDTVHYNPSDLSGWIESLLSELNSYPPSDLDPTRNVQTRVYDDGSEYDLRAITGDNSDPDGGNSRKRMRYGFGSGYDSVTELNRSVVMVDTQETGVRLVHTLMACAEAVQNENLELADALVKHVGLLAASQPGAMRKVATYFAEALARRIYRIYPSDGIAVARSYDDVLQMHFYESCPYLKFAHFTANQAILEASSAAQRVHVIDFGLKQGMQWPALIQALALRPGGVPAPSFRLTGVGPPQPDNPDELQHVGWKLAQFASRIGVEFEFKGLIAENLADLDPEMFEIRPGSECVAISSVLELHRLLARPGFFEKVMATVKALKPEVFAVVEQEADHNDAVFVDRFNSALHYYSSMFDSLEDTPPSQDRVMSELYMGRQILNVVACEGADRVERHEPLACWRARMRSSGLEPVSLGSNAFKQATVLLALFAGGDGYGVEENDGCLTLGWNSRPLIAASAWKLGCAAGSR